MVDQTDTEFQPNRLMNRAKYVSQNAYAPHSGFKVGAAVETESGEIFSGCNTESIAYNPTVHAEQAAVTSAVSSGATNVVQIAVYTPEDEGAMPCGLCRQFLSEFMGPNALIHTGTPEEITTFEFSNLFPHAFDSEEV